MGFGEDGEAALAHLDVEIALLRVGALVELGGEAVPLGLADGLGAEEVLEALRRVADEGAAVHNLEEIVEADRAVREVLLRVLRGRVAGGKGRSGRRGEGTSESQICRKLALLPPKVEDAPETALEIALSSE